MLLLLLACSGSDGTDTAADDTGADTADDTGADTADDTGADTADDTETGDTETGDTGAAHVWTPAVGVYTAPDRSIPVESRWMSPANVGDLDGDGVDELAVTTRERVRFLSVDLYRGTSREIDVTVEGIAGSAARLGNNQYALVGTTVGVYEGLPASGTIALEDAPATIDGAPVGIQAVGDVDGDGLEDVAARYAVGERVLTAVFSGPLPPGASGLETARTVVEGGDGSLACGDLDGDGTGDLVGRTASGSIFVVHGPLAEGRVSVEDVATAWFDLPWPWSDGAVLAIPGDLDGDGRDDLVYVAARSVLLFGGVDRGEVVTAADRYLGSVPMYGWFGRPYGAEWPRDPTADAAGSDADADGAPGLTLAASDGSGDAYVLSWYDAPPAGATLPLADVVLRLDELGGNGTINVLTARLGGPAAADLVAWWTFDDTLHFARAFDVPPGDDPDRDGFGAAEDCDEADPGVHPGAPEIEDGRDQDCDGRVDDRVGTTHAIAEPPHLVGDAGYGLGAAVAAWDDDGDGVESLVVAGEADGGAAVWIVPPGGSLADAAVRRLPYDVTAMANAGDLDGDGIAELLVAARSDLVYVAHAALSGDAEMADDPSISRVDIASPLQAAGTLAPAGDLDGDGLADFLSGGSASEYGDYATSAVLLFTGDRALGDRTSDEAWATFAHDEGQIPGRQQAHAVGDVDGDGTADLVIGTMEGSWLFLGPLDGRTYAWSEAPVSFDASGEAVASGDLDGDGAVEVYLAAGAAEGRVVGFEGPFAAGTFEPADARVDLQAAGPLDGFGTGMLAHGDTLVVTAPWSDGPGVDAGRIYGFVAPAGLLDADEAAAWTYDGASPFDGAGASLTAWDDDGDGARDLVVGIPWRDGAAASEGGAAVLR